VKRLRAPWVWLLLLPAGVLAFSSPQDVKISPLEARSQPKPAVFSHWLHQSQQCFNCHPAIFAQAVEGFTHAQMTAGQFCGACHNGAVTKAISSMRCEACHAAR